MRRECRCEPVPAILTPERREELKGLDIAQMVWDSMEGQPFFWTTAAIVSESMDISLRQAAAALKKLVSQRKLEYGPGTAGGARSFTPRRR